MGRPSPLYHAHRWSQAVGGARMYLKREDLNHYRCAQGEQHRGPGVAREADGQDAHHRGDRRRPARGWRAATVAARLGARMRGLHGRPKTSSARRPTSFRMKLLGAEVCVRGVRLEDPQGRASTKRCATGSATSTTRTTSSATVAGPHPYPMMVRDFNSVIGREARGPGARTGRPPARRLRRLRRRGVFERDGVVPPVPRRCGRGALRGRGGRLRGWRRASTRRPSVRGVRGCCTATAPTSCRTPTGRSRPRTQSPRGSTTPGVGPEHAWLKDTGRATYVAVNDERSAGGRFMRARGPRGSFPPLNRAMRWRMQ